MTFTRIISASVQTPWSLYLIILRTALRLSMRRRELPGSSPPGLDPTFNPVDRSRDVRLPRPGHHLQARCVPGRGGSPTLRGYDGRKGPRCVGAMPFHKARPRSLRPPPKIAGATFENPSSETLPMLPRGTSLPLFMPELEPRFQLSQSSRGGSRNRLIDRHPHTGATFSMPPPSKRPCLSCGPQTCLLTREYKRSAGRSR